MNDFLPFSRPAIGDEEIRAVENVLRSGWITTGPQNHQLEEDFRHKFGCVGMQLLFVRQQRVCI